MFESYKREQEEHSTQCVALNYLEMGLKKNASTMNVARNPHPLETGEFLEQWAI